MYLIVAQVTKRASLALLFRQVIILLEISGLLFARCLSIAGINEKCLYLEVILKI